MWLEIDQTFSSIAFDVPHSLFITMFSLLEISVTCIAVTSWVYSESFFNLSLLSELYPQCSLNYLTGIKSFPPDNAKIIVNSV